MYVELVSQLKQALVTQQQASDRREQTEHMLRLQLERELRAERAKSSASDNASGTGPYFITSDLIINTLPEKHCHRNFNFEIEKKDGNLKQPQIQILIQSYLILADVARANCLSYLQTPEKSVRYGIRF